MGKGDLKVSEEIIYQDEAIAITPDGIAAAAATLAVQSKYLQQHNDLVGAFWYFFDTLVREQKRQERLVMGRKLWTEIADQLWERLPRRIWFALDEAYCNEGLTTPIQDLEPGEVKGIGKKSIKIIRQHLIAHIKDVPESHERAEVAHENRRSEVLRCKWKPPLPE